MDKIKILTDYSCVFWAITLRITRVPQCADAFRLNPFSRVACSHWRSFETHHADWMLIRKLYQSGMDEGEDTNNLSTNTSQSES